MTSRRALTPAAKVLLDAADFIEARGHCKGDYRRGEARCAVGAIMAVGGNLSAEVSAQMKLYEHIGRCHIPSWNDAPERTAEEVIHALRQAAIS